MIVQITAYPHPKNVAGFLDESADTTLEVVWDRGALRLQLPTNPFGDVVNELDLHVRRAGQLRDGHRQL